MTKLPNPNMRSARYGEKNSETERSEGNSSSIGGSVDRRGNNQSQFINYQTYPLQSKVGVAQSNSQSNNYQESPRSKRGAILPGINGSNATSGMNSQLKGQNGGGAGGINPKMMEQTRYQDIMRSINNTE